MKGAMADKNQIFFRRLISVLCPSDTYQYNSGGEPLDIPSLTYEELKQFHSDHYNPANSHIITYGAVDLEATGKEISHALSAIESGKKAPAISKEYI
jgi:Zn-dependent M16 (insulinase) family peptidase